VEFKEVRLRPKIGQGDFDTKVHRAVEFLSDGDRIKVTVQFRGRELTHPEIGRGLLERFVEQIKDHGVVERAPTLEGRAMHITVASTHKAKLAEARATEAKAASDPELATGHGPDGRSDTESRPAPPAVQQPQATVGSDVPATGE
jgi:translation initiation factor IF-3